MHMGIFEQGNDVSRTKLLATFLGRTQSCQLPLQSQQRIPHRDQERSRCKTQSPPRTLPWHQDEMHYSYPSANSRLGKDIFTRNWRDMPQQILAATTLSKIDPLTLDFRFNGIYRLKDRVCKNNTILNWIILDSIDQFRYGHKFVLPITSVLYHTSLPNRKSQRADARETAARHLRGGEGKRAKRGNDNSLSHNRPPAQSSL